MTARRKYLLPHDQNAELVDFRVSERNMKWMMEKKTTELPPQAVKMLRGTKHKRERQYLTCEGFVLENTFPNNIAVMKGGSILYCTAFREPEDPVDPYFVTGLLFLERKPMFTVPMDSSRIGLFTVKHLDSSKFITFSADDIVSKCFIFAHPRPAIDSGIDTEFEVDPVPEFLKSFLATCKTQFSAEFEIFNASEEGVLHKAVSMWDVLSIEVPGRHVF